MTAYKRLKDPRRLSRRQLLLFGLSFALLGGGYLLYSTLAATTYTATCNNLASTVSGAPAGSIVKVQAGDCNFQVNLLNINKDSANPVQITALDPANPPRFRGSAQKGYPAFYVHGSSGLVFGPGLVFSNPNGTGAQMEAINNVTIKSNRFLDNAMQGILVQALSGETNNNVVVDGNEFSGNGADVNLDPHTDAPGTGLHSIYYAGNYGITYGGKIINNWVHDSKNGQAVQVGPAARGTVIAFNTVQRIILAPGADPDRINCIGPYSSLQGSSGVQVWSNVCQDVPGHAVIGYAWDDAVPIVHAENNAADRIGMASFPTVYGVRTTMTLGVNYDENLGDLKLSASGQPTPASSSPLVGKAAANYLPSTDFNGNPRTARTIGAFEPTSTTTPPPPPPPTKPSIPADLTVTPGDRKVTLSWTANPSSQSVDTYQIYEADQYLDLNVPASQTTYVATKDHLGNALANGTAYSFRISAHNSAGYGDWTDAITKTPIASNPPPAKRSDLNGDNTVNISDLAILLSNFNTSNAQADITKDGAVNILDLSVLLSDYGT